MKIEMYVEKTAGDSIAFGDQIRCSEVGDLTATSTICLTSSHPPRENFLCLLRENDGKRPSNIKLSGNACDNTR